MAKRAGITLVEVLVAILIMGVGMLSILTLFPIGLLNCRQALRDDRVYQAVTNASSIAIARNIRYDPNVLAGLKNGHSFFYVDSFGTHMKASAQIPPGGAIQRIDVTWSAGGASFPRWFSLLDDYEFQPNAMPAPDQSGGKQPLYLVGNYTWAYLLRSSQVTTSTSNPALVIPPLIDLFVVVYEGRNTSIPGGETEYTASGNQGDTTLTVTWPAGSLPPAIGKTGWVLDPTNAQFYRVVSMTTVSSDSVYMETQTPLQNNVSKIVVMEKVVEVLDRGTDRPPQP